MSGKIFLTHHSHVDIGYTDPADEVRLLQMRHMDLAVNLCAKHPDFIWTIESAWCVDEYMKSHSAKRVDEMLGYLRSGQLNLQALYTQPLTELASAAELIDECRFAAELSKKYGFTVDCAMINDIGGYAGRLPSAMNEWGVKYLVAGAGSFQVHLPWCEKMPHLFYLSDKGGGKILVWNLGIDRSISPQDMTELDAVYSMGRRYLIEPLRREMKEDSTGGAEADIIFTNENFGVDEGLGQITARLENENYLYDSILLQYGKDNGGPDERLAPLLACQRKSEKFKHLPEIILSSPSEFFKHMEKEFSDMLPVFEGTIADPWNIRANPQPVALKKHRKAQQKLLRAELRAVSGNLRFSPSEIYHNLHMFSDHTCGHTEWGWHKSWNEEQGCRDSQYDLYRSSWSNNFRYADTAAQKSNEFLRFAREASIDKFAKGDKPAVIVWNDTQDSLGGVVKVRFSKTFWNKKISSFGDIPFQRLNMNEYVLCIDKIPPFGQQIIPIDWQTSPYIHFEPEQKAVCPERIENERFRIDFSPENGRIISLLDKVQNRELANCEKYGFGEFIYAKVKGVLPDTSKSGMDTEISHNQYETKFIRAWSLPGELINSVFLEFETGNMKILKEISLEKDSGRVDFRYRINKPETHEKESCMIMFDLNLKDASLRFSQNVGFLEPEKDLLPGSMQDCFYTDNWINLSNKNEGTTIICKDAPIFQAGRIRTLEWLDDEKFQCDRPLVVAWPYHNLLQTDCPIWQDILEIFEYSVIPHYGKFDALQSDAQARGVCQGLEAQFIWSDLQNYAPELKLNSHSSRINSCRYMGNNYEIILEERTGRYDDISLLFNGKTVLECALQPFEIVRKTIRL